MLGLKSRHPHIYKIILRTLVGSSVVSNFILQPDSPYFFYESPYSPYGGSGIFDFLTEKDASSLLHFFCSPEWTSESLAWNINIELAKLLAKRGVLVKDEIERLIQFHYDRETCFSEECFLHLAYLGTNIRFEGLCLELLEKSVEDSRDGIFIACASLRSPKIKLGVERFFQRIHNGATEDLPDEMEAFSYFRTLFHKGWPNRL